MLVGLPSGAIQILTVWISAIGMRYTKNWRWAWAILATAVPFIGSILLLCLPKSNSWGIVVSTWLAAQSSDLIVISLSLLASNVKGNTKKSTVNGKCCPNNMVGKKLTRLCLKALYFVFYSVGCIVGPQLWQAQDAPRYSKGCISSIVSWILLFGCFIGYFVICKRENMRRDRLIGVMVENEHVGVALDSDFTDEQDVRFRYTL